MQRYLPLLRTVSPNLFLGHVKKQARFVLSSSRTSAWSFARAYSENPSPHLPVPNSDEVQATDLNLEGLLDRVKMPYLHPTQCANLVLLIAQNKEVAQRDTYLSQDERFKKLLSVFEAREVDKIPTRAIISCIKALEGLKKVDPNSMAILNMENSLVWRARTSPIRDLVLLLSFVQSRKDREVQKKLFQEVVRALERRWVEVVDGKAFACIMHYPEFFTEQFLNKLDDRVIEIAENLEPSDLVLILSKKGEKKQRSIPLLKALSFHLKRNIKQLSNKDISDSLFALRSLSFKESELLGALCDNVKLSEHDSFSVVRSIITSLGQIRFLHPVLLNDIAKWILPRLESCSEKDLVSFLLTTASLNFAPFDSEKIYEALSEKVTYKSLNNELIWLDVVWSLSILEKQSDDQLASVLSADFYNKLLYSHDHRHVGIIWKVLNLNAVAQFLTPNYKGPTINVQEDPLLRDVKMASNLSKQKLVEMVGDAFSNLAAANTMARLDVNTGMGFVCDIECVFDSHSKPVPIEKLSFFGTNNPEKIPEDFQRVAVQVLGYHDCLVNGTISGISFLQKNLLEKVGFKVLIVNYNDIKTSHKKIDRVKILETKLKNLLK